MDGAAEPTSTCQMPGVGWMDGWMDGEWGECWGSVSATRGNPPRERSRRRKERSCCLKWGEIVACENSKNTTRATRRFPFPSRALHSIDRLRDIGAFIAGHHRHKS